MKTLLIFAALFASASSFASTISCAGTEPFWHIDIKGKTLEYSSPETPEGAKFTVTTIQEAAGAPTDLAKVIKTQFTSLTIVRGSDCTDGMSEQTYTHHAVYEIGGSVLYGCCNMK